MPGEPVLDESVPGEPVLVYKEFSFLYRSPAWWTILVAARGAGKTFAALQFMVHNLINYGPRAECGYFCSLLTQAKRNIERPMATIADQFPRGFIEYKSLEGKYIIHMGRYDKRILSLFSYEEAYTKAGYHPPYLILDECGYMPQDVLGVLSPMVEGTSFERGGKVLCIGTVNGKNNFYKLYKQGCSVEFPKHESYMVKATESHKFTKEYLDFQRQVLSPVEFAKNFECDFEASYNEASIYGRILNKYAANIQDYYEYNPLLPVYTAWDLGKTHRTCIWFYQVYGNTLTFIDYFEDFNKLIPYYVSVLNAKPYNYGMAYLPWDSELHRIEAAMTVSEQLSTYGIRNEPLENKSINSGIEVASAILETCRFNKSKCEIGLNHLREHTWKWNRQLAEYSKEQSDNEHTDCADAFRYACVSKAMLRPETAVHMNKPRTRNYTCNVWSE